MTPRLTNNCLDIVLEDVTELFVCCYGLPQRKELTYYALSSETTPEGVKKTALAQTLLNGSNIAMVSILGAVPWIKLIIIL